MMPRQAVARESRPHRSRDTQVALERRAEEFWRKAYRSSPYLFGRRRSPFAAWAARAVGASRARRTLVELGCGSGRDARFFAARRFDVLALDSSRAAIRAARRLLGTPRVPPAHRVRLVHGRVLRRLRDVPAGSADVVYSHLFYNLHFSPKELGQLFAEAARVLAPGGAHLFAVRSTRDPWCGKGRRIGPNRYDLRPKGVAMQFFDRRIIDRLSRRRFETVRLRPRQEGRGTFPVSVLWVEQRRLE